MGSCLVLTLFLLHVNGVFGDDVVTISVMKGDSVTLNTDITKKQHDKMMWYFENTRIALINGHPNTSCLYDGEGGRFRDRLKVDYETGSLTITNITPEHAGRYEAELIRSDSSGKRQSLNRHRKCDSTKMNLKISSANDDTIKTFNLTIVVMGYSSAAVVGICVAVVLLVFLAAGVIYCCRRRSKHDKKKNKNEAQEKEDLNSICVQCEQSEVLAER